ncbi:DUF6011 domain-containing protein [Actinosynnema sp. NPDC023587]|uniref:DUF6011 domain-containing protein n=1 Tax=Actinosynnema sp. NPDC023587 TaxID=3154695 RepID=UPI0033C1AA5A
MTTTTAAPATTTRCTRCGRVLRAARSIAKGYGRGCETKIRAAIKAEATAGFKDAAIEKAEQVIADGGIVAIRTRHTPVFRVAASKGDGFYLAAPQACNCPAGLRSIHPCYHRIAAAILTATANLQSIHPRRAATGLAAAA